MPAAPTGSSPVRVEVLGDPQVVRDGRRVELPPSRRTRALLGFLAITHRPQLRQRLCDLLWDGPHDPRAALRWSLAKLRPLVDGDRPRLVTQGDGVELQLGPGELDLAEVKELLANGVHTADVAALRRASERFQGELLEGLEVPGCFQFEEWLAAERSSARQLRLSILEVLASRCDAVPEEALVHARARVGIDTLSETAHAAVIRLLGRLGRVREGMEQYDACRQILARALGARPSAELERARLALTAPRAASNPPPVAPEPVVPGFGEERSSPSPLPAFIGRTAEQALLERMVADAKGGRSRVLLVQGEPGMGKSRMLDQLTILVRRAGGRAARGRAYEAESLRPYSVWLEILRDAPLAELDEIQRAELAPLLPELAPAAPSSDQNRLFDAVAHALATLAAERPLAVILDDVHWLDEQSTALLHFLSRSLRRVPMLLACAARGGELADNPAMLRVMRTLSRSAETARMELTPLGPEETAALARSVGNGEDAGRIYEESEGNPLLALEVARALRAGTDVSRSLDALLAERLEHLPARAREVLPWAAALGRSFPVDRLALVTGMQVTELLPAVEELERRGVLRPTEASGYDFVHDLVRGAAYRSLSVPRRALLHREVARAMVSLPDPDGAVAGEIAHHAALADDAELAAQASVGAAARAARLFARSEAHNLVERGLGFARRLPVQLRLSISLALLRVAVDVSRTAGGDHGLVTQIQKLVDEARAMGLAAEEAAGYAILVHAHFANRDDTHAAEMLRHDPTRVVDPDQAALAMTEVAGCLVFLEQDIPRARLLVEACTKLGRLPSRAAVYVLSTTAMIKAMEGEFEAAAAGFESALAIIAEGAPWEECTLLLHLGLVRLALGRPDLAEDCASRMEAAAPRLGTMGQSYASRALRTVAQRIAGAPIDELALRDVLDPLELDAKAHFAELVCALSERELATGRGDLDLCRSILHRACTAAEQLRRPSLIVRTHALLARAEYVRGDLEAARAHLEAARRALTPSVPVVRAMRLLDEMSRALRVAPRATASVDAQRGAR